MSPKTRTDHQADHAYARWAVDNEPQSFPAPHVIEHTSFMAGYKIARADLLALLKRAEAALEDVCKLSAILGEPDNPLPPHVVRFDDGSEERGRVADLAVEVVLSVNLAAKQAASVLSDLRDVLKEQA